MVKIAKVLFPVAVGTPFDYEIPPDLKLARGDFVYAPIGKQSKLGVVWDVFDDPKPKRKLKPVFEQKPCKPLNKELMKFVDFTAQYNCALPGMVLRMVIRSYKALEPSKMVTRYTPVNNIPLHGLSPARHKVLRLEGPWPLRASEIAQLAGVSPSVIKGMAAVGQLGSVREPMDPPFGRPNPDHDGRRFKLTAHQNLAAGELIKLVQRPGFMVALLDGVTGSGKTEVY
ncbi:MAG TPA: primosomal protein N', partial [Hellea balneolensis]|nr:primosomal protein N' [Hellea balneolensis]